MDQNKLHIVSNCVKTSVCWIAGCRVIKYAIDKTGSLAPLLCLLFLPKYQLSFTVNKKGGEDDVRNEREDSEKRSGLHGEYEAAGEPDVEDAEVQE